MPRPKTIVEPRDLPVRKTHSQVITVTGGTLVFVAGMTSRSEVDASPVWPGDMRAQIRQVCENIGRALRSVGAEFSDVVKTTTYVTDIEEFFKHVDVRMEYFGPAMPTSTTVEVRRLAHADFLVEVDDAGFWLDLQPLPMAPSLPVDGEVSVHRWLASNQFENARAQVLSKPPKK